MKKTYQDCMDFLKLIVSHIKTLSSFHEHILDVLLLNEDYDKLTILSSILSTKLKIMLGETKIFTESHSKDKWESFLYLLEISESKYPQFLKIQVAQAILESGWGQSELFQEHNNPYGMKYRDVMEDYAIPVNYKDDKYCKFNSIHAAIDGYWAFIERSVYEGFQECKTLQQYITHITYAGYYGGPHDGSIESTKSKDEYIRKVLAIANNLGN